MPTSYIDLFLCPKCRFRLTCKWFDLKKFKCRSYENMEKFVKEYIPEIEKKEG